MQLNPKIREIIRDEHEILRDDIQDVFVLYFISLYHNLNTDVLFDEFLKKQANTLGIVDRDYKKKTIVWKVPLFLENGVAPPETDDNWDWVHSEYRRLFMDVEGSKGGDKQGCIKKMKIYFSKNPHVRKEDVIEAATMYINPFAQGINDKRFLQNADYFISKQLVEEGKKTSKSRLDQYLELINENKTTNSTHLKRGLV